MKITYTLMFVVLMVQLSAQVTFNKRVHFGYHGSVATSILPTDSCFYSTGVVVDTVPPYNTGSFFAKFDLEGNLLWSKALTSTERTYAAWFNSLNMLGDGTFVLTSLLYDPSERTLFVKYSGQGDTVFTREYTNPYLPTFDRIQPRGGLGLLPDGGFIVSNWIDNGDPFVDPNAEVYVFRTDSLGTMLWDTVFHDPAWDRPTSLVVDGEGNTVLGWVSDNTNTVWEDFTSQVVLVKINPSGEIIWEYATPVSIGLRDAPNDMVLLGDGSLVIASGIGTEIEHPAGNRLFFEKMLFKLSPDMEIVWETQLPDPEFDGLSKLTNVIEMSDGRGFVVAGMDGEDISGNEAYAINGSVSKVSTDGEHLWTRRYIGINGDQPRHEVFDLEECPDGGLILVGESRDGTGDTYPSQQAWLLKLDAYGCLIPGCHLIDAVGEESQQEVELAIYPNPATDYLNFQLRGSGLSQKGEFRIVDAEGQMTMSFHADVRRGDTFIVPVWGWAAGIYFLQYVDGMDGSVVSERFVVAHQ